MGKTTSLALVAAVIFSLAAAVILGAGPKDEPTHRILDTSELVLDQNDLREIGVSGGDIKCQNEEYETGEGSPLSQYSFCNFTMDDIGGTYVVFQLQKFTNLEDRDGSYQYNSLHLRGSEGLLGEDEFGDLSRFTVNSEKDYGGQYDDLDIYYYHLWICKDEYLIHITSKGTDDVKEDIAAMGRQMMSKFK